MPEITHLSSLDASFLHIESAEMPMHVASVHLLELPPDYAGDFFADIQAHVASRLHLAKVFTRKLAPMPFDLSNPVWVDDEDIDLEHHVRHVMLPKPGSWAQLERLVARLHSQLLDRSRPLWEIALIEGLASGERVLYAKVHHAGIDGQAGVAVGRALFDLEPTDRVVRKPRPRWRSDRYQLGIAELASAAFVNTLRQSATLLRTAPAVVRAAARLVAPTSGTDGHRSWWPARTRLFAPRTPFNVAITNQRSWAARSVPLADVKAIAKARGATLNDVVLAICSGALRRYLTEYDALPPASLVAVVPVSLRAEGDETANNQVSMVTMTLASDSRDPLDRLATIARASKQTKSGIDRAVAALPSDLPSIGAPWLVSGLASLYGRSRLANWIPQLANLAISNVPGAPVPLHFAGARLRSYYPVSIPVHGVALNITLNSYDGRLDFGLVACRRALPDIGDFGDHLVAEFRVLRDVALQPAAAPVVALPRTSTAKQRSATKKASARGAGAAA